MSTSKDYEVVFHHVVYEIPNFQLSAAVGNGIMDNFKILLSNDKKCFIIFIYLFMTSRFIFLIVFC